MGSGILLNHDIDRTPMGFFLALLTVGVVDSLNSCISDYAAKKLSQPEHLKNRSRLHQWEPIGHSEMYKFLSTLVAMSVMPKPRISEYWSTKPYLLTPFFGQMFSRNRFQLIYNTMLHVSEPDSEGQSKIEPFIKLLLESFQDAYYPFKDVSIDEMVIGYKGRWKHKQYNKTKPSKYHIKTYGLCDSATGYFYNLFVYYGKQTKFSPASDNYKAHAVKVFDTLMQPLNSAHHIFADRFYTGMELIEYLVAKGYNYTGTLNVSHKGFPQELKTQVIPEQEPIYYVKDDGQQKLLCCSWL